MKDLFPIAIAGWLILSWITHVIVSIKTGSWLLLIAGSIVFPVGCIHGTGVWLGVF